MFELLVTRINQLALAFARRLMLKRSKTAIVRQAAAAAAASSKFETANYGDDAAKWRSTLAQVKNTGKRNVRHVDAARSFEYDEYLDSYTRRKRKRRRRRFRLEF